MSQYKAMIFDLDGTLLDSKQDIVMATNITLKKMGAQKLPGELIVSYVGHGARNLVESALAEVGKIEKLPMALDFLMKYYFDHCLDHSKLFADVFEVLQKLSRQKIKMAVLTNKPQILTDKILKGFQIVDLFEIVLGSGSGYPDKPEPQGLHFLLEKMKIQPSETLFIGDSLVDLQTADHVMMDCALHLNGFSKRSEIESQRERAKILYEDFTMLLNFI